MIQIVPLAAKHCDEVARLHLSYLESGYRRIPGQRLLRAYYRSVAEEAGAYGYVAEHQGTVLGYVCGVWDPSKLRAVLLGRCWPELLVWGSAQLAINPTLMLHFLVRMKEASKMRRAASESGYELRPIVVVPAARGTGIAARLVTTLLADARRRGFQSLHLVTEVDNETAQHFYDKLGFSQTGSLYRYGLSYLRYERSVL